MDLDKQKFDFYLSIKQLNKMVLFYSCFTHCFFKGKLFSELCDKGVKSKFDDSVYIGTGFFKDISTRLVKN